MKYFPFLLILIAMTATSCKTTNPKVASANTYQNNPYYGPSSSTTDYSSTPSSVPNVPSVPTYNQPTYSAPAYSAPASSSVGSSAGGGSHTVASGENLYRISLKHGTTVAAIKNANGLTGDAIRTGQKLIIP